MKKKQKMYKTHFLPNNESLIASYKNCAAKLYKTKYTAKKMFFGEKFDQTIEALLPNNKEALPTINKIVEDDNDICETAATVATAHYFNNC